jgi:2-amino-4-hydroxy-6-hydroxymethyldihydropteridine diphosphokinase
MTTVYLALGANLGDRQAAIAAAASRLAAAGVTVEALSPLYETDAVTPDPQPLYLNAAARVRTVLPPRELLAVCLEVERALGRVRPPDRPLAARTLDIDLLLYGETIVDESPTIVVPHPRLLERPFVRIPLADVAERGLVHPITREPLDRAAPSPAVRRLAGRVLPGPT